MNEEKTAEALRKTKYAFNSKTGLARELLTGRVPVPSTTRRSQGGEAPCHHAVPWDRRVVLGNLNGSFKLDPSKAPFLRKGYGRFLSTSGNH